jgi:hypothetical protein
VSRWNDEERVVSYLNFSMLFLLEKLDSHIQKNKVGPCVASFIKINLKWFYDLNIKPKVKKFQEENGGKSL